MDAQPTITANGYTAPAARVYRCYRSVEEAKTAYFRSEITIEELEAQVASIIGREEESWNESS